MGELSTRKLLRKQDISDFQDALQLLTGVSRRAEWYGAVSRLEELLKSSQTAVPGQVPALSAQARNIVHLQSQAAKFVVVSQERIGENAKMTTAYRQGAARFPELSSEFTLICGTYAVGFYDAAVFHSMRVTEFLLKKVAACMGVTFSPSWDALRQRLSKEIDRRTRSADLRWQKHEAFFSSILFDIQAISKECRNGVVHDLGTKYDRDSARRVLAAVEGLVCHVANTLPEGSLGNAASP